MNASLTGLHHLTAIASDAQANLDFYTGVLGLRLVKQTVNFDDPSAYHLYYGDATGSPGTIVTFFAWPGAPRGRIGSGQPTGISLSAPAGSLGTWRERLTRRGFPATRITRFGEEVLTFADPDGIPVEIVAVPNDPRPGWSGGELPAGAALRGLHTVELTVTDAAATERLLTGVMGYRLVRREGERARYEVGAGGSGTTVDLIANPRAPRGSGGTGTIHHIAYRVPTDAAEVALQEQLLQADLAVSGVRDRDYFRSIYYREPGGILFEIATDVPGFAVDEPVESLGSQLKLPRQFEPARSQIEALLPPLRAPRPTTTATA